VETGSRQHAHREDLEEAAAHSSGVAETECRDRKMLNAGDLAVRGWHPQPRTKAESQGRGQGEESDGFVLPMKPVKAGRGKGPSSMMRTMQ
jgi:hypothetical protein